MRRHISLYFGSITSGYILNSLGALFISPILGRRVLQKRLQAIIQRRLGNDISVFTCRSARASIALCLQAVKELKAGASNDVLISAYTCLAVPTGVLAAGMTPVYTDIDRESMNTGSKAIENSGNAKIAALLLQHTMGSIADTGYIKKYCSENEIFLIEDCALAIGSRNGFNEVGTTGDASIFSMEVSKTISLGWGGVLVVRNPVLAAKVNEIYNKLSPVGFTYEITTIIQTCILGISYHPVLYHLGGKYIIYFGYKYKLFRLSTPAIELSGKVLSTFLQKIGSPLLWLASYQWKRLDYVSTVTDRNFRLLQQHLEHLGFNVIGDYSSTKIVVTPRIAFLVKNKKTIIDFFAEHDIEIGVWFDGPLTPPPKAPVFGYEKLKFQNAYFIANHVVNLPCHSRISEKDIVKMKSILSRYKENNPHESTK